MGCAVSALPARRTVNIGLGVTGTKTSGLILPPTINWASALDPCARPCISSFRLCRTEVFSGPSIIDPMEPAYATFSTARSAASKSVEDPASAAPRAAQPLRTSSSLLVKPLVIDPRSSLMRQKFKTVIIYDLVRYLSDVLNGFLHF